MGKFKLFMKKDVAMIKFMIQAYFFWNLFPLRPEFDAFGLSSLFRWNTMFPQEVEEKMKTMSPVMFEDFIKPFRVNFEEVLSCPYCINWLKKLLI